MMMITALTLCSVMLVSASATSWSLASDSISLQVTADSTSTNAFCISSMQLNMPTSTIPGSPKSWTANLVNPTCAFGHASSNTGLTLSSEPHTLFPRWDAGTSSVDSSVPHTLNITGLVMARSNGAVISTEDWLLTILNDTTFGWGVRRTYKSGSPPSDIVSHRAVALALMAPMNSHPDNFPYNSSQIWGFVDPTAELNATMGFFAGQSPDGAWYQMTSKKTEQRLHLAPLNDYVAWGVTQGIGSFAFGKPACDGTARTFTVGLEAAQSETEWAVALSVPVFRYQLSDAATTPYMNVTLPNATMQDLVIDFAQTQDQWMGWIFGNNPASVPCLQEMGWWPMFQVHYTSKVTMETTARQYDFFAHGGGINATNGDVWSRWSLGPNVGRGYENSGGFYNPPWGVMQDQYPNLIIHGYYTVLGSGASLLANVLPAAVAVGARMIASIDPTTSVYVSPNSGLPDNGMHSQNWWDIVEFGHYDALVNAQVIEAVRCLAELHALNGDAAADAKLTALHAKLITAHNAMFWNEEKGFYADWIDVNGTARYYFYVDVDTYSVMYGIAGPVRAKRILKLLEERELALMKMYNTSLDAIWATPSNLYPLGPGDCVDTSGQGKPCPKQWPSYENGELFFHSTGFEIAAWGIAGDPDKAYEKFELVMNTGYVYNKFYCQAVDWVTNQYSTDPDPLNNVLLILWGLFRGAFGIDVSVRNGVTLAPRAAQKLNGARHCFLSMGETVCVCVLNSVPKMC